MYKLQIGLDINSEIFPVKVDEYFSMKIVESVSDDTPATDYFSVANADSQFVDEHDYVMHGKVFKYTLEKEEESKTLVSHYISFGGLLMKITGDLNYLKKLEMDSNVWLGLKRL